MSDDDVLQDFLRDPKEIEDCLKCGCLHLSRLQFAHPRLQNRLVQWSQCIEEDAASMSLPKGPEDKFDDGYKN